MTTATRLSPRLLQYQMDRLNRQVELNQNHCKELAIELYAIPEDQHIYNGNSYYKKRLYDIMKARADADLIIAKFLEKTHQYIIHKANSALAKQSDARICSYQVISPGNLVLTLNPGNSTPEQLAKIHQTLDQTRIIAIRELKERYPRLINSTSERKPALEEPTAKRRAISYNEA